MHFLIDAQLPPALARWLSDQGYSADHVVDLGLGGASDEVIWDHALTNAQVIVSKDDDFAIRRSLVAIGPPIVWVRFGNVSRTQTIARFERVLPVVIEALNQGEALVETA